MNRCARIRGCPASQYLSCKAWLESVECWETDSPRCSADFRLCLQFGCPVYEKYTERMDNALRARAQETLRTSRSREDEGPTESSG
jgi:hypothetical protein